MSESESLTDKIFNIVVCADKPLTVAQIKRILPDPVEREEISSRLVKLAKKGFVFSGKTNRTANTGPKVINCYASKPFDVFVDSRSHFGNRFQLLLETQ